MVHQLPKLMVCVFVLVLEASCSPSNWLEGSIIEEFSLEFDRVEASVLGCIIKIEYIKESALGPSVPCGVIVDREDIDVKEGVRVKGQEFLDNVTIYRSATSGGAFPKVDNGWIRFDELLLRFDKPIAGEFEVEFEAGNFDTTHTLIGRFAEGLLEPNPYLECN